MAPYDRSNQGVVSAGKAHYKEARIKTIDTGYAIPGRLVIRDTDDEHVKVAGAGSAVVTGFLIPVPSHDSDTDFVTEAWVRIGRGNCVVTLTLTTGQTAVEGADLYPAAHGALKTTATSTERPIGKADESVTTSTLVEAPIRVRYEQ
jgi:predicted Zn-dependent protease